MNFVTYKENETVDNNANYFLMEIESNNSGNDNIANFSELDIEIKNASVMDNIKPDSENFPLFCFENENVNNVADLNLNSLKKFSHDCLKKYIFVSLQHTSKTDAGYLKAKSFNDWHNSNTAVKLTFLVGNSSHEYCGKISKIFHKHYQPTINNSNP